LSKFKDRKRVNKKRDEKYRYKLMDEREKKKAYTHT
jgi:hypothetical protein